MKLPYLRQDCSQSLREALQDYFAGIPGLLDETNAPKDVADLFRFHDVCHVVFGCDTTLAGEPLADTWSVFGTTVTLRAYLRYAELPEARAIFVKAGILRSALATIVSLPRLLRVMWRAWRMPKKWDFWNPDPWMDVPLAQIRAEHGIRVVEH